jgi:hypothetical protein
MVANGLDEILAAFLTDKRVEQAIDGPGGLLVPPLGRRVAEPVSGARDTPAIERQFALWRVEPHPALARLRQSGEQLFALAGGTATIAVAAVRAS